MEKGKSGNAEKNLYSVSQEDWSSINSKQRLMPYPINKVIPPSTHEMLQNLASPLKRFEDPPTVDLLPQKPH
eukprot:m.155639 g.155639  ORF g.155639 m.155639 type:complete len:72 (+) comp24660_c0_seq2:1089-1304(+)